ncbi:MAG: type 4a pilus biogenesis protein PilO [Myxococcales bacterium]|nr:type 4a pilus biogenesis protein PilO [Myxococcales bacterium]
MDKFYSLIQKTPTVQKVALLAVVLVMMGVGYYFIVHQELVDKLKALDARNRKLEEELQEKMEIANNISKFRKKVEYLQQRLEEKKKNLPEDANMDQLLKTLNELSEKSDMRIIQFVPQPEVAQAFYAEIPVKMDIEGNYSEIATFFDKISKEDRIINVTDISMSEPKIRNGKVILKASCLAKTFRTVAQAAAGAAAPATPAAVTPPPAR